MPDIELINTGSELMRGAVLNTHQQWICRQLASLGCVVGRQVAVADSGDAIRGAVQDALSRAELIITTGGLGPTSDDLTREKIAELLGLSLNEDPVILDAIRKFFAARKRPMPDRTRVQALVPEGATVLPNRHGTAPGLAIEIDPARVPRSARHALLIMLPGPPRELRPMFGESVIPLIKQRFPLERPHVCRVLRTTGLGESWIEEKIASPLAPLLEQGLELGYCAKVGEVDIRLAAWGQDAATLVSKGEQIICGEIGRHVFGTEDDQLESIVVRILSERQQTLAVAESCTGGFIAHRITNVPGASAVLLCGLVTYSNQSKQQLLQVPEETLSRFGAVSEPTACAMAQGVRVLAGATYGLAVTGIAGPSGVEKPAGTVFIALASSERTVCLRQVNAYDRETFKHVTSQQALDLIRRTVLKLEP